MIEICNLRNEKPSQPYDVVVDRTSVLGNPFYMKNENERDTVCESYDKRLKIIVGSWIEDKELKNRAMFTEIYRLVQIYKDHGKLRLFCWCAPKRCHVESIRDFILGIMKRIK